MVTVMAEKKMMTVEGLKKLEDELHERKVIIRKEIADKIKEAREQGDLSENAEYDAARDEQRDNEAKIEELENLIKNAVVISDDDIDHNVANLGSAVTLKDLESGKEGDGYKYRGRGLIQITGRANYQAFQIGRAHV